MNKIKKIVLSGGPFSGKSTLVTEFKNLGFPVSQEAALLVIEDLNNSIGIQEQIKFRDQNINEFQNLIYEKQIEMEKHAISEAIKNELDYIICDRGVYDALAYYQLFNKKIDPSLYEKIKSNHYDFAFICEVLPNFDPRTETGRFEDRELSEKLSNYSYNIYDKYTSSAIWLPVLSVEERLSFITDYFD